MGLLERLKAAAKSLKRELVALAGAARDPRTPWYARAVAGMVVAYALSPIDLIPDFIPVLGYLDDLILVPAGLWLAIRLVPAEVMAEHRLRAEAGARLPASRSGLAAVVAIWMAAVAAFAWWLW